MRILAVDIGNTRTHWGLLEQPPQAGTEAWVLAEGDRETGKLAEPGPTGLSGIVADLFQQGHGPELLAWCSVVPKTAEALETLLPSLKLPAFRLTAGVCPRLGLALTYPRPDEIGQDRLANAFAAQAVYEGPALAPGEHAPAIVIDLGTAVTFDVVTRHGGYEGGIIAPGLALMTGYLHEQTALLPKLDPNDLAAPEGIGKSTLEAMKVGTAVGFAGMIRALLERVLAELERRGESPPNIVATGGSAGALPGAWLAEGIRFRPNLTLRGLAEAARRDQAVRTGKLGTK